MTTTSVQLKEFRRSIVSLKRHGLILDLRDTPAEKHWKITMASGQSVVCTIDTDDSNVALGIARYKLFTAYPARVIVSAEKVD